MSVVSANVAEASATLKAGEAFASLAEEFGPALAQEFASLQTKITIFKRIPHNVAGYPVARPNDCMAITDLMSDFCDRYERYFSVQDARFCARFFDLITDFTQSDIKAYPSEVLRLNLVKAKALVMAGRPDEALEMVAPYAQRPYLIEDQYGLLVRVIEVDTVARLSAGRAEELTSVALGRLRLLAAWQPKTARHRFRDLVPAIALGVNANSDVFSNRVIRKIAQFLMAKRTWRTHNNYLKYVSKYSGVEGLASSLAIFLARRSRKNWHKSGIQIIKVPLNDEKAPVLQQVLPESSGDQEDRPVLVTRAMGGLGDLAMMTPGVSVLAKRFRQPVYFATKKAFFPVFENNPEVRLIDIDSYFDVSQFRAWYNISRCPATRYESKHAPLVKKSRVETFAKGMAVRKRHLDATGWVPKIHLSKEQKEFSANFRAKYASDGRPLIGIQPFSRDTYKNCDAIFDAALRLSEKYRVVIMHTSPVPMEGNDNIILATGNTLREVIALVSAMDYYIAVDSAFYHITAAFSVPTLGIFGPTDGRTLSIHHPRHHLVPLPVKFACAPCWRNENSRCIVTNNSRSACLSSISGHNISDEFEVMREKFAVDRLEV